MTRSPNSNYSNHRSTQLTPTKMKATKKLQTRLTRPITIPHSPPIYVCNKISKNLMQTQQRDKD